MPEAAAACKLILKMISRQYGNIFALRELSMAVNDREFVTILGPSGSGKSTILNIIAGFVFPTGGSVVLDGKDITDWRADKRGIGMVFQNYALFPHMSAAENVGYGLRVRGVKRSAREARVRELLKLVQLEESGRKFPKELSGGQQQRIAFARAIAFQPSLILMDEPLGALDRELRATMGVELRRLHDEAAATTLFVTHDRDEALALSDRIAILNGGRLVAFDSPSQLFNAPQSSFVARFFSGHNLLPLDCARAVASGQARISMRGCQSVVRSAQEWAEGLPCALAVPEEAVRIFETCPDSGGKLVFPAEVLGTTYTGKGVRVQVKTVDGTAVTGYLSDADGSLSIQRSQPVWIQLAETDCSVVRADD